MSALQLSNTTLTNAVAANTTTLVVGATTGMSAGTTGSGTATIIVAGKEAMKVLSIPVAGTVVVVRGTNGTIARPIAAGARLWFGTPNQFALIKDSVGVLADPSVALPPYLTPGQKVSDGYGNEFILCDFTATVHSGVVVGISNDGLWTATPALVGNCAVGVVAEQTSTSDYMGLVQVYGVCSGQDAAGTSGITSAYFPIIAGSVSSPATGMTALVGTTSTAQKIIYGMFITGDATSTVSSAASATGIALPLFLNYPYCYAAATDIGFS